MQWHDVTPKILGGTMGRPGKILTDLACFVHAKHDAQSLQSKECYATKLSC